ncbi:hypothetical protein [Criblamydia sequanensis]|uniref:hypothetical protein n=1 Tax=Candidatus Criblamydia sequanensis TaxID=340071 RepID=UPI0012AC129D|nr:hypothetical protein [Criblamydia sequanensis]
MSNFLPFQSMGLKEHQEKWVLLFGKVCLQTHGLEKIEKAHSSQLKNFQLLGYFL